MFILFLIFHDLDVFHVTTSKDDIIEFLLRRRNEIVRLAVFCTEGVDILESDGRLFRIDFV